MDPRKTVLLVVDAQRGFVTSRTRHAVPVMVQLVEGWRAAGAPLVFARFHNPPGSPYERITGWTRLRTAAEQALIDELAQHAEGAVAILDKSQSSVFTTEGIELFRSSGWDDVVLCGIDTDSCVYDSAIDAYQAGFRPWIATDACASNGGPEYHEAALKLAARNIARTQLVTASAALSRLRPEEGVSSS